MLTLKKTMLFSRELLFFIYNQYNNEKPLKSLPFKWLVVEKKVNYKAPMLSNFYNSCCVSVNVASNITDKAIDNGNVSNIEFTYQIFIVYIYNKTYF